MPMNTPLAQVAIAEITHLLTTDFDSQNLLSIITERTRRAFGATWCVLVLKSVDAPGIELVCESTDSSFEPPRDLVHRVPVALSALNGSVVMIDDFDIASPRWAAFAESATLHGLGGCRVFPLRLAQATLGSLAVFTVDPWTSRERSNSYGQSMADLAAIALSLRGIDNRTEAATVAAQQILLSRSTIELAAGMIAELDDIDIGSAMGTMAAAAKAQGMSLTQYARKMVEDPGFR